MVVFEWLDSKDAGVAAGAGGVAGGDGAEELGEELEGFLCVYRWD